MESKVQLQCLSKDVALVESIKAECEAKFADVIRNECKINFTSTIILDTKHFLEEENPHW
jgi:hypothetical protein